MIKKYLRRYFVDAMSYMALGLFSSLIVGLIISQLAKIPYLDILSSFTGVLSASSPVVGGAIGAAGTIILAAVMRRLTWKNLKDTFVDTSRNTGNFLVFTFFINTTSMSLVVVV